MLEGARGEKESEEARRGEEGRRGGRDKKIQGWAGTGLGGGGGGGRKAKSITSLLEPSQKGKDMSQCTDCTSLPHWMEANSLVCVKSPVLELELGSVETGAAFCVSVRVCLWTDSGILCCMFDRATSRGAHVEH